MSSTSQEASRDHTQIEKRGCFCAAAFGGQGCEYDSQRRDAGRELGFVERKTERNFWRYKTSLFLQPAWQQPGTNVVSEYRFNATRDMRSLAGSTDQLLEILMSPRVRNATQGAMAPVRGTSRIPGTTRVRDTLSISRSGTETESCEPDQPIPPLQTTDAVVMSIGIVAHASPRFRGARTREEAKQRNKKLADARAAAVFAALKRISRREFEGNIEYEYNVAYSDVHDSAANVIIGTESRGDTDALESSKGDTSANNQLYRRVDVNIQFSVRKIVDAGSTTTTIVQPSTRNWEVAVTELITGGVAIGTAGLGLLLKNRKTEQVVKCSSTLYGGTTPNLGSGGSAQRGKEKWVFFKTGEPANWDDFVGTQVVMSSMGISYVGSLERARLHFPGLRANGLNVSDWATGGSTPSIGAFRMSGKLKFTKPGAKLVPKTIHDFTPKIETDDVYIPVYFDTGKSHVVGNNLKTLAELVRQATTQFKQRRGLYGR